MPESERFIPNEYIDFITEVMPLDLYEAQSLGLNLDSDTQSQNLENEDLFQSTENETTSQYLGRIADRFKNSVPEIASRITGGILQFNGRAHFHSDKKGMAGIAQVFDVGKVPYKLDRTKCVIATVASQQGMGATLQLDFDSRLLAKMKSNFKKGVLFLHEIVFLWVREKGGDSFKVRKITALLIQNQIRRSQLIELIGAYRLNVKDSLYAEDRIESKLQEFYYNQILSQRYEIYKWLIAADIKRQYKISDFKPLLNDQNRIVILQKSFVYSESNLINELKSKLSKARSKKKKVEIQGSIESHEASLTQFKKELATSQKLQEGFENALAASETVLAKIRVDLAQYFDSQVRPVLDSMSVQPCWKTEEHYAEAKKWASFFAEQAFSVGDVTSRSSIFSSRGRCDDFIIGATKY